MALPHGAWNLCNKAMLTGVPLGKAIRRALEAKREASGLSFRAMAQTVFKVRAESINGWMKTGAISKPHFEHLRRYVADVVEPGHWGDPALDAPDLETPENALLARLMQIAGGISDTGLRHLIIEAESYATRYPATPKKRVRPAA